MELKKQEVWIEASIDLIVEQSITDYDYLQDEQQYVYPTEGYFMTPGELVAKLKEAYEAGYKRRDEEVYGSHDGDPYPDSGEDFIKKQKIEQ